MNSFCRLALLIFATAANAWCAGQSERIQAKVLKVFAGTDGVHRCRAYLIEWKGHQVVADDPLVRTRAHSGDVITVLVSALPYPQDKEPYGLLHFTALGDYRPDAVAPAATSTNEEQHEPPSRQALRITQVFSAEDGNNRFRAYAVKWEGQEVIVFDRLIKVDRPAGEELLTLVMKHPFPQGREPYGLLGLAPVPAPRGFLARWLGR